MERLTSDNTFEMDMTDLALNQVFVRDGWAWYRKAPEDECSVCDLIRSVAANGMVLDGIDFDPGLSDEDMGDIMLDWLQFGEKEPEGVLAILYRALWAMAELRERLFAYEDTMPLDRVQELAQAEKDGRLAMLPCKVGDTVYEANKRGLISTYKVISIHISECSLLIGWELMDGIYSNLNGFEVSALGKTVFLTREEAEAALKKREADNETVERSKTITISPPPNDQLTLEQLRENDK